MIPNYIKISDAFDELKELDYIQRNKIIEIFAKFRHLTNKEKDLFLESIRQYTKLYSITLDLQRTDEELGITVAGKCE